MHGSQLGFSTAPSSRRRAWGAAVPFSDSSASGSTQTQNNVNVRYNDTVSNKYRLMALSIGCDLEARRQEEEGGKKQRVAHSLNFSVGKGNVAAKRVGDAGWRGDGKSGNLTRIRKKREMCGAGWLVREKHEPPPVSVELKCLAAPPGTFDLD